jgi:hypothetical protein
MSNIRSFYVAKYYEKTTKSDKHVLVGFFFDKAHRFLICFCEGISQLRITLPTSVSCFRQSFVVSNKRFVEISRASKLDNSHDGITPLLCPGINAAK